MKTLRLTKFNPNTNSASLYWEENEFRWNTDLDISSLTEVQQAAVGGALAWAVSQLPQGFDSLESVELFRADDVITEWSQDDPPEPISTSPVFLASVVGWGVREGKRRESSIEIKSTPGLETNALAGLWDQLAAE